MVQFIKDLHFVCSDTSKVLTNGISKDEWVMRALLRSGGYIGVACGVLVLGAQASVVSVCKKISK